MCHFVLRHNTSSLSFFISFSVLLSVDPTFMPKSIVAMWVSYAAFFKMYIRSFENFILLNDFRGVVA